MTLLPNKKKPWTATHMRYADRNREDKYSWGRERVIHGWVPCTRNLEVPLPEWVERAGLSCKNNCTTGATMPRILRQGYKEPICPEQLLKSYRSDYVWRGSRNDRAVEEQTNANPT